MSSEEDPTSGMMLQHSAHVSIPARSIETECNLHVVGFGTPSLLIDPESKDPWRPTGVSKSLGGMDKPHQTTSLTPELGGRLRREFATMEVNQHPHKAYQTALQINGVNCIRSEDPAW
ncbi:hypothetical protein N7539_004709 [Penicillium diatomitis]|uniref:Uncharacterized protein n=1 Tax=Penicillium diatomitis TaxID=2819901 RepID=A0A9W9X5X5_9EURO|nr:uncharacterized protein N7539_004709 [Penicillium diatomitis]KAJ5484721.1 hypothetical protein N7539_004709 [Penicillium diatomitis]